MPSSFRRSPVKTPTAAAPGYAWRFCLVPNDDEHIELFRGAIANLLDFSYWDDSEGMQAADVIQEFQQTDMSISNPFIGMILPAATDNPPSSDWLLCDGRTLSDADYPELGQQISAFLRVDTTHFKIPDLRHRFPYGAQLFDTIGEKIGSNSITLTSSNMPPHSHTLSPHTHAESTAVPTAITIGAGVPAPSALPAVGATGLSGGGVTGSAGSGAAIDSTPAATLVNYWIVAR